MTQDLELLLLADVHYVHRAQHECPIPQRRARWGRELVRRVARRLAREDPPDVVVLMGDLVDHGGAPGAEEDLAELRDEIAALGVPMIAVPGNHDGSADRMARVFGDRPGAHEVKGYRLLTFADPYQPTQEPTRSAEDLALPARIAAEYPRAPIVAFQHNPLHPPIESTYPYNLTNASSVMASYEEAGVVLSVSAHYHPGLMAQTVGGVGYLTCPALCEAPFRFLRVTVKGRSFSVRHDRLALEAPAPLIDLHVHTQYAYCRDDVTATEAIARASAFGVDRICLTEHAGQLYLSAEDYWGGRFREEAGIIARERAAGRGRMRQFREEMQPLRSPRVGLGLEVELDADRRLTLLDEDREGWDVLIGAVHVLPAIHRDHAGAKAIAREFMADTEALARSGIDLLAHPFRVFRRAKLASPVHLHEPLAQLLADTGVAVEANFHGNEPDPRFLERCLHHGVKIALGSDSHGLWEVGDLHPHLHLLQQLVPDEKLSEVLYPGRPPE